MAKSEADIKSAFDVYAQNGRLSVDKLQQALVPLLGFQDMDTVTSTLGEILPAVSESLTLDQFQTLVHHISPTNYTELRDTFNMFDKNNDGYISRTEYQHVMNKLGQEMEEDVLEQIFKEADTNRDGMIDFNEFLKMVQETM